MHFVWLIFANEAKNWKILKLYQQNHLHMITQFTIKYSEIRNFLSEILATDVETM